MFIAKFVNGPMDGREMQLQKLDLTIHVDVQVYPGSPSARDEIIFEKSTYIRKADQHRSKSPGSKIPYVYMWDGVGE